MPKQKSIYAALLLSAVLLGTSERASAQTWDDADDQNVPQLASAAPLPADVITAASATPPPPADVIPSALRSVTFLGQVSTPTGPPPTPAHTGFRALAINLAHDFAHLPSKENLFWLGVGTGAALAAHPFDDDVNRGLVGNGTADAVFIPGKYVGQTYTLLGTAITIYAVGRINGEKRVSHLGMDLIRALIVDYTLTESIKYATHRERPDHSNFKSFPSGHASTTFAFATALERHLGWKYVAPAYVFSSYVAISRLHDNRHYLSDVAFGAALGVIAGRTVTRHGSSDYTMMVVPAHGGVAIMMAKNLLP